MAAIVAVQHVEGDVLYPLVVGRTVALHPLALLLALTAGAVRGGGAVGAFLAVPLLAVVNTALGVLAEDDAREEQDESALSHGAGGQASSA